MADPINKVIAKKLGRSGGKATLEKHGKEHFRKIIKKRWDSVKANKKATSEALIDK